jgi:hypothetical protein
MFAAAVRAVVLSLCCLAFAELTPPPAPQPAPLKPGYPFLQQAGPPETAADHRPDGWPNGWRDAALGLRRF